jgi:fumarate hydratase class II
MPQDLIYAITAIKIASAHANFSLKKLDQQKAKAIMQSGETILTGKLNDQFPLKI